MDDSGTNDLARPQISTTPTATESVPTPIPPAVPPRTFQTYVPPKPVINVDDDLPNPADQDEISTPPSQLAPLSTDLTTLTERLNTYQQSLEKNNDISDLKLSFNALTTYLTENTYPYKIWPNIERGDPAVAKIKEEIRGLKGLLINLRNFPKIPASPTTYSTQSLASKLPTGSQIPEIE
ncbi:13041_t:CDS:2 [Racocetra fulgida]|uniref:13041_t:CDS:1 n=1 Tax=Racocetra fulgida TaxID=60492 RepID=A0A9N9BMC0_9GLOM|nr:13041_t:CDS:2 [Racocetra fulgida]